MSSAVYRIEAGWSPGPSPADQTGAATGRAGSAGAAASQTSGQAGQSSTAGIPSGSWGYAQGSQSAWAHSGGQHNQPWGNDRGSGSSDLQHQERANSSSYWHGNGYWNNNNYWPSNDSWHHNHWWSGGWASRNRDGDGGYDEDRGHFKLNVPEFSVEAGMRDYRKHVALFEKLSRTAPLKQAMLLLTRITDAATSEHCEVLTLDDFRLLREAENPVSALLAHLASKYEDIEVHQRGKLIDEWLFDITRKPGEEVREFASRLEALELRARPAMADAPLPDEFRAHLCS